MSKRIGPTDYALKPQIPNGYSCDKCGAFGCKLWRDYQTTKDLLCCDCAGAKEQKSVEFIDERGCVRGSDAIGTMVPAVPIPVGGRFWGYTSVPPEAVAWWRSLPTRVQS